ncbi:unnamed protein product [Amoebophrya sp. A120]|nr:unnamed protein product [Amoebophrya sp. A120]|eukprot:GSA120T00012517001.1
MFWRGNRVGGPASTNTNRAESSGAATAGSSTAQQQQLRSEQEQRDAALAARLAQEGEDEQLAWALSGEMGASGPPIINPSPAMGPLGGGSGSGSNHGPGFSPFAPAGKGQQKGATPGHANFQPTMGKTGGNAPGNKGARNNAHGDNMVLVQPAGGGQPVLIPASALPGLMQQAQQVQREETNDEMVYVACEINQVMVEMMIDTGAQNSVISKPLVDRLKLNSKLNTMRQGVASGVGTAKILGTLENVAVTFNLVEFFLDFVVLDMKEPLFMLGIDQMRRFKCILDLEKECIIFGGKGGVEIPFLKGAGRHGGQHPLAGSCPQM